MASLLKIILATSCWLLFAGCTDRPSRPPAFKLFAETALERRESLSTLRQAWLERPTEVCEETSLYERSLLYRTAFYGRRINGSETYEETCAFWVECVREHVARFPENAGRFHRIKEKASWF